MMKCISDVTVVLTKVMSILSKHKIFYFQGKQDRLMPSFLRHNQCDQIGRFIALWATFLSLCQQ